MGNPGKLLLEIKRAILLIVETIALGPSYGTFMYRMRSNKPWDPRETWDHFVKRRGRPIEWLIDNYPPKIARWLLIHAYYRRSHSFRHHSAAISEHYGISGDFYELFLDKKYRFYSCADFLRSTDTLEDAQENKANYLLTLIDPKPGERILELACGRGGMLKKIYDKTGDRENLYGYTLAREEKDFVDENYGFHCELRDFITTQYEDKFFDKIFSVEGLEHARECELLPLCKKLFNALKPGGKLVLQLICQIDDIISARYIVGGLQVVLGAEFTPLKKHLSFFEQAKFRTTHLSVHDFRPTIKAFFDRLVDNREVAVQLVGGRTYNKFQFFFAAGWRAFDEHDTILLRLVLERPEEENYQ